MTKQQSEPLPITDRLLTWVDRRRYWLAGVTGAIYLAAFNGQWQPGPDSAEHVSTADQLIHGQGFTHPTGWHEFLNPGLSYLLAAIGRPFSQVSFGMSLGVMFLISLVTLALAFELLRVQFGRKAAVLLTVMLTLTETYFRLTFELLTDMPFCLGMMLLLLGYSYISPPPEIGPRAIDVPSDIPPPTSHMSSLKSLAGWAMLIGGIVIMTMFRSVVLTVLVGVAIAVGVQLVRGRQRGRVVMIAVVCLGAWLVGRALDPRGGDVWGLVHDENRAMVSVLYELPATLGRMVTLNLPKLATESTAEALFAVDFGPVISVGLIVVVALVWLRLWCVNVLWASIAMAFFVQWLLFLPGDRYFLPILLPLLAGWWASAVWLEHRWPRRSTRVIGGVMLVLWISPNVVRIARVIVEQRQVPFIERYEDGRYASLQKLGEQIREHVGEDDLVVSADGQVLTWYSGRQVMDPKQLRLIAGMNKTRIAEELSRYPQFFVVKPFDPGQQHILQRMPASLGKPIAVVPRRAGRGTWTLHPGRVDPQFLKKLESLKKRRARRQRREAESNDPAGPAR